jgi:two-component system, NarL family, nitrate/nitrite sensor histidine kinase NarX
MLGYVSRSLLLRAGLAMGLITALAVAGMTSAVLVARSSYGEAAAVNQAGSLRMQSYRIAAALEAGGNGQAVLYGDLGTLATEFEERLTSSRLADVVDTSGRKSVQEAYRLIDDRWQQEILPLLSRHRVVSSATQPAEDARLVFRSTVGGFVADIDNLVRLLEEDAESRIHLLGLFQSVSLFLTLAVAAATLYLLQIDVLGPLHALLDATELAGKGDFTARVSHTGADELGRLGRTFNTMAADLSKMYGELERRVVEKTRELTQRNQSLELLYSATQYLTEASISEPTYRKLISDIGRVVGADSIALCRKGDDKDSAHLIARSGRMPPMCESADCDLCLGNGQTRSLGDDGCVEAAGYLSVRVGDKENHNGALLVEIKPNEKLETWQIQLLEALGKHIGISLDVSRRVIQQRRLALLEERSAMARELHDSLAQSLTYLKIQVARLSLLACSGENESAVDDALGELKEGLNTAYRQLRELLTSFRLQMDGQGLGPALSKTVDEFNARGEVAVRLDNKLEGSPFGVNEEIHVLQLVREALSNVVHHAQATSARVSLGFEDEITVRVSIEDDGIGIPYKAERSQHYGLAIMQERASSLRGDLRIEAQPDRGTRVCLRFQPAALVQAHQTSEGAPAT